MTTARPALSWTLRLIAVAILFQTLFFKFTAAPESVEIFSTLGVEPWGRIAAGIAELVAVVLLLIPATAAFGALLAIAVMMGAIASHLGPLGIEVAGDGGLLFGLALIVTAASAVTVVLHRHQLPVGRLSRSAAAAAIVAGGLLVTGTADAAEINATRFGKVAIKGYDAVAYHLEGKPVEGSKDFTFDWMGATWRFASSEHRDLFAGDPERYAPAYGGWCAYGVSKGGLYDIDPKAWTVHEGRLYLNYSLEVRDTWLEDVGGFVAKADARWPDLSKKE